MFFRQYRPDELRRTHREARCVGRNIAAQADSRPLLAGKSDDELARFISDTLASRMPYYSKAAASFPSDRLETIEEIDETVNKFVNTFNLPLKP